MVFIITAWIVSSIVSFGPAIAGAVRVKRSGLDRPIAMYIFAALIGAAIDDAIAAILSILSLRTLILESMPTFGIIILTIGHIIRVVPMIVFSLFMLNIINTTNGGKHTK